MRVMLVEKDVYNLIETDPIPASVGIWKQKIKENWIAMGIAMQIIKECVNNDIFNNIINITNVKKIWEKLRISCFQVGQAVVYSIL